MKKRKIFAVAMAAVMTLSMVACGEQTSNEVTPTTAPTATTAPTEAPTAAPTAAPVEASIDFEDGNYGFVMMRTKPRKADDSKLSIVEYNGSKALFVENAGGAEMHVGIDVDAILGDKVTEVRSISMTVGSVHPDGVFSAVSGVLSVFTGEKLAETQIGDWSVYMEKKNPKTVTFTLPEDVSFTAGQDNYISFGKLTDVAAVPGSLYIDDICFFDANGAALKGDTTVVMEAPDGFLRVVEEEEDTPAANVVKVKTEESYAGDWGQSSIVPADVLSQFAGQDVTLKAKFELTGDKDYYIWAPMDSTWAKIGDQVGIAVKAAAEEGDLYHAQADATIVIDDHSITEVTLNLPAALVDQILAAGDGSFSAMTYGVTVFEVELSGAASSVIKEKVAGDEGYVGDWGQSAIVPADVLSKFAGLDVKVTAKFELTGDKDYYIWAPMDSTWAKIGDQVGIAVKAAAEEGDLYHAQADATIVIDDHSITELTLNLPAALVDQILAAGDGSLSGMTYGVVVYEVVLEAEGGAVATVKEKVAGDESYVGDWGQSAIVPADVLSKFAGLDVKVTAKFELTGDKDYYIWAPMDSTWAKIGDQVGIAVKAAAEEGDLYHAQADATIVIDDHSITELTYNLPAALVDQILAAGDGSLSGMTYGVVVYEVVLEAEAAAAAAPAPVKEKVAGDENYVGDWGQSCVIPADVLSKFAGMDVKFTAKFELTGDKDYYIWAPMDSTWKKIGDQVGVAVKAAAEEGDLYHAQADATIVIDDHSISEVTITLPAALVDEILAAGDGSLSGMVYGVVVYEAVLEGVAAN